MVYSDVLEQLFYKIDRRPGITMQCDTVESSETNTTVFPRKAIDVCFSLLHPLVFVVSLHL